MPCLEEALRADSRVKERLTHQRDAAAAEAAVRFFTAGALSPKPDWYRSETWRQIMDVVAEISTDPDRNWYTTTNNDPGSLRTEHEQLNVGQVIEIEGDGKYRCVTSTMGSSGKFHAHFKSQGVIPLGPVRWRRVSPAPVLAQKIKDPSPQVKNNNARPSPLLGDAPEDSEKPITLWERIKKHPLVSSLLVFGTVVATLGSFTEGLDKLIQFVKKYFGG